MTKFFSERLKELVPYTPGEQPKNGEYVKLNTNESPFGISPKGKEMATDALKRLQLYPDPEYTALREKAAEVFGVDKDEIVVGNGSDEILDLAFKAFCDDERHAVFADITYGFYNVFAKQNGIKFREIPLKDDYTIDLDEYNGNDTVFLANPNAPTGICKDVEEIERFLAKNKNRVVVVDEAYVDFGGKSCLPLIKKYDNLLVCQTFSKSRSMAGGRLGFGFGNGELIKDLNTVRYSINPYNVNGVTAAAGVGILTDEEYTKKNCETIIKNREFTVKELEKLGFETLESKANFVFTKNKTISGKELYEKLKERRILVRYFDKERLRDYNRVTIGSREQMETLLAAVKEILEEKR